jgi:hypothetical protein
MPIPECELRMTRRDNASPIIEGYAAVYNSLSQDLGGFIERIAPGFFAPVISTADCRALMNHDPNLILGRTSAGTCRLFDDARGLRFEVDAPDTSAGRDAMVSIERRDITGCSFDFTVDVDQWDWSGAVPIRTLMVCRDLFDVGPVVYPAYEATSVSARSIEVASAGDPAVRAARLSRQRLLRLRLSLRPPMKD